MTVATQDLPETMPQHNKYFAEYICTTCNAHIGVGFGAVSLKGYTAYKMQGFDTSGQFLLPFNFVGEAPAPTHIVHIVRDHCLVCG